MVLSWSDDFMVIFYQFLVRLLIAIIVLSDSVVRWFNGHILPAPCKTPQSSCYQMVIFYQTHQSSSYQMVLSSSDDFMVIFYQLLVSHFIAIMLSDICYMHKLGFSALSTEHTEAKWSGKHLQFRGISCISLTKAKRDQKHVK